MYAILGLKYVLAISVVTAMRSLFGAVALILVYRWTNEEIAKQAMPLLLNPRSPFFRQKGIKGNDQKDEQKDVEF